MQLSFISCLEIAEEEATPLILETEQVSPTDPDQILAVDDSLVRPVIYQNIPALNHLPVPEAKEKFISAVLPAILVVKERIERDQLRVINLLNKSKWTVEDSAFYLDQSERFKAKDIKGLIARMETHPTSIVLAQAVVESGWGSSRFFQEANNLFGIWSYRSSEPRIQAGNSRQGTSIYLRKYDDITGSIADYFETVGRSRAYGNFRDARAQSDDIQMLLPHLKHYSERGAAYITQLKNIIRQNDLTQYDHYRIAPNYFTRLAVE